MNDSISASTLHITIGSGPSFEAGTALPERLSVIRLEHELRLVKAALLYGDQATLYSPFISLAVRTLRFTEEPIKHQLRYLEAASARWSTPREPAAFSHEEIERYRSILRKPYLKSKQLLLKQQFEQKLQRFQEAARKLASDAGGDGILQAIDSGRLKIHSFRPSLQAAMEDTDQAVEEFLAIMRASVSNASTYPLLNASLGDWIGAGIREGSITVSEAASIRGREVGLAAELFERLPVFDIATVQEILDIRQELERPLVRFRAKIIEFSETVKHGQWDKDFALDAERVFRREVAPAILDIEEEAKTNHLVRSLVRKTIDKPLVVPGGSVLAAALARLDVLPSIVSLALGPVIASSVLAVDAVTEWRQKNQQIQKNALYFYYTTGKRLQALP
ncbi:MAG: hypothetical protein M3Q65_07135 [Chloroflexota bacterium]|nr:hypothetical protein [Chloroflexota bacterium]